MDQTFNAPGNQQEEKKSKPGISIEDSFNG